MTTHRLAFKSDSKTFVILASPPSGLRMLLRVLSEPGLQFAWLARWQMALEARGRTFASRAIHLVNLRLTGGEFGHRCSVGPGFVAKHPLGMVIGGGTRFGQNCTVLHNATFGERRPDRVTEGALYPLIGDDCLIGTGAVVLGAITIGDGARVGAGAVVLHDVGAGVTVVGSPATPQHRANYPLSRGRQTRFEHSRTQ